MRLGASVLLTCSFVSPLFGATPPPEQPFDSTFWEARSERKPAAEFRLGIFEIRFEESTLSQVVRAAGKGKIDHQGDAGESVYWVCYTVEQEQRIWIIAHGEMGGSNHAITSVSAQHLPNAKPKKDCPSLPISLRPASLHHGLWLGVTEAEASKSLGAPSHSEGAWWSFDYQTKVPGKCEPNGYDLGNWLLIKFTNGQADTIIAGQVTSC